MRFARKSSRVLKKKKLCILSFFLYNKTRNTKWGNEMLKNIIIFSLCFFAVSGCSQCLSLRSEYYDISGKAFTAKDSPQDVEIFTEKPARPFEEIGYIKVLARYGTAKKVLDEQMKLRASSVGADAVVGVEYGEDKSNELLFCGKMLSTKRNAVAVGKAVIFTDKQEKGQ